ncbi:MAG: hypothetical protein N2322_01970, partial [Terrimicrobiaceae bacterium]|nr:hypothetical protein [Terrimicrobiaceae bacterium]
LSFIKAIRWSMTGIRSFSFCAKPSLRTELVNRPPPHAALWCLLLAGLASAPCFAAPILGPFGFGEAARGGEGGQVVVVSDPTALKNALVDPEPLVIRVAGPMRVGTLPVGSRKTIEAAGPGATLHGTLMIPRGSRDIIIRGLTLTNPTKKKDQEGFDGISIRGGRDIWVDQCTFVDCGDGALDITEASDRITVSRCKFHYTSPKMAHRFPMLVSSPAKKKHRIHLTVARNWFAENCGSRMPAAVSARVHLVNNFFDCPGNDYCANARKNAEILSEGNVYLEVRNPLYAEDGGRVRSSGDRFEGTSGRRARGDDDVFEPPYKLKRMKAGDVPGRVRDEAGAPAR